GEELALRARRLLLEADEIERAARRIGDPLSGTLHLGVIPTISPYLLPSVTPAIRRALPRLRIAWLEDKTAVLVAKLRQGEIDGALLSLEADVGDVASEVIATDAFAVVTPPDHPLAQRKGAVTEAELRGQELMLLTEGHCFRDQALEACRASRVREGELRATSLSTLVQMVAGGDGITLVPELALEAETRRADLAVRPLAAPAAHRTIALAWRKGAALEVALRATAATIRAAYPRGAGRGRAKA
ncbi:MAG: LysR family transcriptional regulator, partial [Myxococcales bacterium]|nr:LysR family transcriptional regulator [Myxococcales bacterium]